MAKNKKSTEFRATTSTTEDKNTAIIQPRFQRQHLKFHIALVLLTAIVLVVALKSMTAHADSGGMLSSGQMAAGNLYNPRIYSTLYTPPSTGTLTLTVNYTGGTPDYVSLGVAMNNGGNWTEITKSTYGNPIVLQFNVEHVEYQFNIASEGAAGSYTLSYSLVNNNLPPTTSYYRSMPCSYQAWWEKAPYYNTDGKCPTTPSPSPTTSTPRPSSTPTPTPAPTSHPTSPGQGATGPTVPASLIALSTGPTTIALIWDAASAPGSSVASYRIYRGSSSTSLSLLTTVTSPSYTDTSVSASTTYYYYVVAMDKAGNISAPSNTVSATSNTSLASPTVIISNPKNGTTVSGIVDLNGLSNTSASPIKLVQVEVDNNGFVSAAGTASWDYKLNTRLYADTTHTISAKVTDSTGMSNTTSITLTFKNGSYPAEPPLTTGTWVSPEGMTVHVDSKGKNPHTGQPWTVADAYYMVKACATGTGDFGKIAPYYTVNIIDDVGNAAPAQAYTVIGVGTGFDGNWSNFGATSELNGSQDPMLTVPYDVVCYEYGHAWTNYYYYLVHYPASADNLHNSGMTSPPNYLSERWVNKDGSITLAQNNYCDKSVDRWDGCMTDDRRILFGGPGTNGGDDTADRVPGESYTRYREPNVGYINSLIIPPQEQPGLASWYTSHWIIGE